MVARRRVPVRSRRHRHQVGRDAGPPGSHARWRRAPERPCWPATSRGCSAWSPRPNRQSGGTGHHRPQTGECWIAVMRSNTAVRPNTHQGGKVMDQQKGWSAWLLPTDADSELRPHPYRDASKSVRTRGRIISVSAAERPFGGPGGLDLCDAEAALPLTHDRRRRSYVVYRHTVHAFANAALTPASLATSLTSCPIHTALHLHVCTPLRYSSLQLALPHQPDPAHPYLSVVPLPSPRTIQIQHTRAVHPRRRLAADGATQQLPGSAAGSLARWRVASPPSRHGCRAPNAPPTATRFAITAASWCPRRPDAHRALVALSASSVSVGVSSVRPSSFRRPVPVQRPLVRPPRPVSSV
jgi:hypothetical protein